MKTVGIVINTSWNIYNFRLGLLNDLRKKDYHIVTIAPHDDFSEKLTALGIDHHDIIINNKGTNPLEDLKLVMAFYRLYKAIKPDVLLHYTIKPNIYGTIAAGLLGIPVISNISGLGTVFLNDGLSSKIARLLYRCVLKTPKKVFFQNKDDQALFINSKLVSEERTELLAGSGIDTEKFLPINNVKISFSFLFIARLVRDKGLIEYVDAAKTLKKKYPAIKIAVLGAFYPGNPTAITESEMQQWEQEGIITYLGTHEDVASVIAQTECVVLPSYREGLSRVLLEAASMAKPIVTTNAPGCRHVVDDGINGFLCKIKDTADLTHQMEKFYLLGQEQKDEMGKKGREKVLAEFDEDFVIQSYRSAIENILSK